MEKDKIKFNLNNEFHMLRHFSEITQQQLSYFTSHGYNSLEIKQELNQSGSRFFPNFAQNINQLLNRLFTNEFEVLKGINDNIILYSKNNKLLYPNGVGTAGITQINQLNDSEKKAIYIADNRGYKLKHLKINVATIAFEYCVILKKVNEDYQFITGFPGFPAMPIPDYKMGKSLFIKCKEFWNQHVFLVVE